MTLHPTFAGILAAHGARKPAPYQPVECGLTDAQRVVAIEGLLSKADGEAISLTFRMDADLRAILVRQLAGLRDALRRTQEARQ